MFFSVPDPYGIDEDIFNLNITELTSLDFMLMAESTFRLDIMLEVHYATMQMLFRHPLEPHFCIYIVNLGAT